MMPDSVVVSFIAICVYLHSNQIVEKLPEGKPHCTLGA
nr:hypothetical protein WG33_0292 [uncultured bacterium]